MIERAKDAFEDPQSRARVMRWLWLVFTVFMLFGFAVMMYLVFLRA